VLLFGQLLRQLVNLATQFRTDLGVEINQLLSVLGNLAVILAVELRIELANLGGQFAVDLFNLVHNLVLGLVQLVAKLALDETDLFQELFLQRLALPDDGLDGIVVGNGGGGKRLSKRNWNVAADFFGGGGTFLGILCAADTFVGNCTPSVLVSRADLAGMSLALSLANGLALWLVLAKLLPDHVAVRNREDGALVFQGQTTTLLILHAAFTLLDGGARPEVLGGTLIAVDSFALLLPNVVVNSVASFGNLSSILLVLKKLETGSSLSQNQADGDDL